MAPGVRVRVAALTALFSVVAAPAQQPVLFVDEPSDAVVLAVAFDGGHDTDPFAAVLAESRLRAARLAVPAATVCGHRVVADTSVLFVVVPPDSWQLGERFVRELLANESSLVDDELRLSIAHCALQADDAAHVYPGDVLAARARAQLGAGRSFAVPLRGDPAATAAIEPAQVRARLRAAAPPAVLVLGKVAPALREALASLSTAPLPPVAAALGLATPTSPVAADRSEVPALVHERVDAPYVAAAFVAPTPCDGAFVLAVQVARARAQKRFGLTRNGAAAHAPFVAWSWLGGDPVVVFHRRSPDPAFRLPQEPEGRPAAAVAAATRLELAALLQDLVAVPPTAIELAVAREAVQVERGRGVAPAGAVTAAAVLPGRAIARLLAARRPAVEANLDTVGVAEVHAALVAHFPPDRACWHVLLPVPRSDRAWPMR